VHQIACLVGYGASCVNPYLALETVREIVENVKAAAQRQLAAAGDDEARLQKAKAAVAEAEALTYGLAVANYRTALENGLLKIMSKMGISIVSSYRGAQIFEAIGISSKLIDECFTGTCSQIEGVGYEEIAAESLARHQLAFAGAVPVEAGKLEDP